MPAISESFTAEDAKAATEQKSFTAEDAKDAEEEKSFTAEDAKDAEEEKSFTAEDAKVAEDYKYEFEVTASSLPGPLVPPHAAVSATFATLGFVLIRIPWRPWL